MLLRKSSPINLDQSGTLLVIFSSTRGTHCSINCRLTIHQLHSKALTFYGVFLAPTRVTDRWQATNSKGEWNAIVNIHFVSPTELLFISTEDLQANDNPLDHRPQFENDYRYLSTQTRCGRQVVYGRRKWPSTSKHYYAHPNLTAKTPFSEKIHRLQWIPSVLNRMSSDEFPGPGRISILFSGHSSDPDLAVSCGASSCMKTSFSQGTILWEHNRFGHVGVLVLVFHSKLQGMLWVLFSFTKKTNFRKFP